MNRHQTSFFDFPAVNRLGSRLKIDPGRLRGARIAFLKNSEGQSVSLGQIPEAQRAAFRAEVDYAPLSLLRRHVSHIDDAEKLVLRTRRGFSIESVILKPRTGRVALCISSQVGCAAACRFCATGHMGVVEDLAYDEILGQVVTANEALVNSGSRVRNLVFMGMGEPMHNTSAVVRAIETLVDPTAFDHPASRILVSTVGVPDKWIAMVRRLPDINYALSLHSAVASTRERIIPLARRYSLEELRGAIVEINALQTSKRAVMVEYVVLDGVNDSAADVDKLLHWLEGLRVHVNLIPYNAISDAPELRCAPRQVIEQLGCRLREAGYPTTIRYSLGQDIEAACGQLVRRENRALKAEAAIAGRGAPSVGI